MKLKDLPSLDAVRAELARRHLSHFLRLAWPHFESGPFSRGRHIDMMADRFEAVNRGEARRVLINIPRRHTKSDLASVCWPAWTWLQGDRGWPLAGPWVKFIFASHSHELAVELSRRCRTLIESPWYRSLAGDAVQIREDANTLTSWQLEAGGGRRAFSIETRQTGFGADVFVVDDPHDIREVESTASRESVRIFFQELVPGNINDPNNNARVVIAQRTHARDLSALILEGTERYDHLCLPGLYDPDHPNLSSDDWRVEAGEPLWDGRFTREAYEALAGTAYARAAQVQQNPSVRGGGIFAHAQWQFADDYPRGMRLGRYWDKAATAEGGGGDPDYTAGVLGGYDDRTGKFYVVDVQRGRWGSHQVEQRISLVAREIDGNEVSIWLEQEPGASGKDVIAHYQRLLRGFAVRPDRPTHKPVRVEPFLAAVEAGNVVLVRKRYAGSGQGVAAEPASWVAPFLAECDEFTGNDDTHDDQVVAAASLFSRMAVARLPLVWSWLIGVFLAASEWLPYYSGLHG